MTNNKRLWAELEPGNTLHSTVRAPWYKDWRHQPFFHT